MPTPSLPVLDATAAAIDVGSEQLHVSIAGGPPKVFGTTTGELHALRDYFLGSSGNLVGEVERSRSVGRVNSAVRPAADSVGIRAGRVTASRRISLRIRCARPVWAQCGM